LSARFFIYKIESERKIHVRLGDELVRVGSEFWIATVRNNGEERQHSVHCVINSIWSYGHYFNELNQLSAELTVNPEFVDWLKSLGKDAEIKIYD